MTIVIVLNIIDSIKLGAKITMRKSKILLAVLYDWIRRFIGFDEE